jgi:hypothetical protein
MAMSNSSSPQLVLAVPPISPKWAYSPSRFLRSVFGKVFAICKPASPLFAFRSQSSGPQASNSGGYNYDSAEAQRLLSRVARVGENQIC